MKMDGVELLGDVYERIWGDLEEVVVDEDL